jgi:hypothetical protein
LLYRATEQRWRKPHYHRAFCYWPSVYTAPATMRYTVQHDSALSTRGRRRAEVPGALARATIR